MKNIMKEEICTRQLSTRLSEKTAVTSNQKLAIFGESPTFQDKVYVGRPNVGNRQHLLDRITDILDIKWLSNSGKYVQEFEGRIAALLSVKHCIVTCNGTVALELAAKAAIRCPDDTGRHQQGMYTHSICCGAWANYQPTTL